MIDAKQSRQSGVDKDEETPARSATAEAAQHNSRSTKGSNVKLKRLWKVGRYNRPNGIPVNVWKGRDPQTGCDVYYYTVRGARQVINESELRTKWKRLGN